MRLFVSIALACLVASCARPFEADKVPAMHLLVMDFELSPGLRDTTRAIRGWWLGATTVYQNPRAGTMFADLLTAELAVYPFLNMFSRVDLRYYFAEKKGRLQESYDYLLDDEIADLMRQVPPLDFARDLGADMLLTGRIIDNQLSENRTFHWWSSTVHVECRLTNVLSGAVEWEKEYELKKYFASQYSAQEEVARQVVEDLRDEYFGSLTVAPVL